ncbi:DNA repair protein RecN [Arsenophonus endosymbiont of Bemisia tabaci Q2]|nr:DNA repair protein RecN [Arsenophonus endosymbiont of Bemisia tabaci Q2]
MLEEALIQINKVSNELRHYGDRTELDPPQLFELEQRIAKYVNLAHKHLVAPELLFELHLQLLAEQEKLNQQQDDFDHLISQVEVQHQYALEIAGKLHQIRQQYASELSQLITNSMHQLSMHHGYFTVDVDFNPEHLQIDGESQVEFNVTTNPGKPHETLIKIASGGELSCIALSIQVITAQKMDTPALIFDEVDVGISGATAAVVGKLLRELGNSTQVMCVTHL